MQYCKSQNIIIFVSVFVFDHHPPTLFFTCYYQFLKCQVESLTRHIPVNNQSCGKILSANITTRVTSFFWEHKYLSFELKKWKNLRKTFFIFYDVFYLGRPVVSIVIIRKLVMWLEFKLKLNNKFFELSSQLEKSVKIKENKLRLSCAKPRSSFKSTSKKFLRFKKKCHK